MLIFMPTRIVNDFGNIYFGFLANPPIEIGFSSRNELRSFHQLKINANVSNRMKRSSHKIKKQLKIVKSRTVTFHHEQKVSYKSVVKVNTAQTMKHLENLRTK